MKYTEEEHASNLLAILEEDDPCIFCPVTSTGTVYIDVPTHICGVCLSFVGAYWDARMRCPCNRFGKEEAIKRTWLKLEEKGYLA